MQSLLTCLQINESFQIMRRRYFPVIFLSWNQARVCIFCNVISALHRNVDYTIFDFIHYFLFYHICSMANFQINILRNTKASYLNQIEFSSKHLFPVTVDYLRSFERQAFDCCFPFREQCAGIGIENLRFHRKERTQVSIPLSVST